MSIYERMKKKPIVIDAKAQKQKETDDLIDEMMQPTEENTELACQPEQPTAIEPAGEPQEAMLNPFSGDDEDADAIDAIRDTINPDPERLPMIANSTNPRAGAVGDIVTDYLTDIAGNKQAGLKELATFGKSIVRHCLKHQIGTAGKDNRAQKYLDTLGARYQFEQEKELSAGDKAFGRK